MNKRFDNIYLGVITGLILPVFVLLIVFLYRFKNYSITEFFDFLKTMKLLSKLVSLCIIPNLLLFFIYIWTDNDHSAKGVLGATIGWAFIILIMKIAF